MNQPLTVTLTQKAPLTSLLLGMVTLIALIVLPFFGAVTGGSSVGDINLYPDADRQNIMLCRGGYRP